MKAKFKNTLVIASIVMIGLGVYSNYDCYVSNSILDGNQLLAENIEALTQSTAEVPNGKVLVHLSYDKVTCWRDIEDRSKFKDSECTESDGRKYLKRVYWHKYERYEVKGCRLYDIDFVAVWWELCDKENTNVECNNGDETSDPGKDGYYDYQNWEKIYL